MELLHDDSWFRTESQSEIVYELWRSGFMDSGLLLCCRQNSRGSFIISMVICGLTWNLFCWFFWFIGVVLSSWSKTFAGPFLIWKAWWIVEQTTHVIYNIFGRFYRRKCKSIYLFFCPFSPLLTELKRKCSLQMLKKVSLTPF